MFSMSIEPRCRRNLYHFNVLSMKNHNEEMQLEKQGEHKLKRRNANSSEVIMIQKRGQAEKVLRNEKSLVFQLVTKKTTDGYELTLDRHQNTASLVNYHKNTKW